MVSGNTMTAVLDLGMIPDYLNISIGAISATTLYINSAEKLAGTFRKVFMPGTGSTVPGLFQMSTANSSIVCPVPTGHRFIKIEAQAAIVDGTTFQVIFGEFA